MGVHEDVIVSMNLYKNKVLTKEEVKEINNKEHFAKAKNAAIHYLSYKMRSEKELIQKLKSLDFNEYIIEDIIYYLKEEGFLNDEEYIKSFFHDKATIYHHSINKIAYDLEAKIIDKHLISKYKDLYHEIDRDNIQYFVDKKLDEYTNKYEDNAYYKLINFLYKKGFNLYDIKDILKKKNKP